MDFRNRSGEAGEDYAVRLLEGKGMELIKRNVRTPYGEIDLLMEDNGTLVVVEVKSRSSYSHGLAEESVSFKQQRRIVNAANYILSRQPNPDRLMRIDVVALQFDGTGVTANHIVNALP